jgi:hypothetical protein
MRIGVARRTTEAATPCMILPSDYACLNLLQVLRTFALLQANFNGQKKVAQSVKKHLHTCLLHVLCLHDNDREQHETYAPRHLPSVR